MAPGLSLPRSSRLEHLVPNSTSSKIVLHPEFLLEWLFVDFLLKLLVVVLGSHEGMTYV